MSNVHDFDLRDLIATWGEVMFDAGAGDGNFITIAYDNPVVAEHEGAQGDVTVMVTTSKKGTATIVLGQASPLNDLLSAAAAITRSGGGLVKKPLMVTHTKGTFKAFAKTAYIRETPEAAFGNEHQNREWVLGLADLELHIGGGVR
jgi:hypothetical protein